MRYIKQTEGGPRASFLLLLPFLLTLGFQPKFALASNTGFTPPGKEKAKKQQSDLIYMLLAKGGNSGGGVATAAAAVEVTVVIKAMAEKTAKLTEKMLIK